MALLTKYANAALPGILEPGEAPKPAHTYSGLGRLWQQSLAPKERQPEGEELSRVDSWWFVVCREAARRLHDSSMDVLYGSQQKRIPPMTTLSNTRWSVILRTTNHELRTTNPIPLPPLALHPHILSIVPYHNWRQEFL
jgi:hypothetical protein